MKDAVKEPGHYARFPNAVGKAFLCALNTHRLLDSVKKEAEEPCTTE